MAFHGLPRQVRRHVDVLREMLRDWALGHHLLLIGNQGVGKNKLADRLLQLLVAEREYVQLHRDTTVQSLTLAPTVEDGKVRSLPSSPPRSPPRSAPAISPAISLAISPAISPAICPGDLP